ncbi:hypothetical protein JR316_0006876 [Psilocybe cubensis]|nr:hypothetical protein JR316_0006876 [Psilocybe cubensis]KAH9480278.1 hypothetical protein JR316_0006876 [Psilocybe cubensis]
MWSKLVDMAFVACFFLFARAFLFYDFAYLRMVPTTGSDLLSSPMNRDIATLYNATTPPSNGIYDDALPPSWGPAMATNFTTNDDELPMESVFEDGSHAFAQKPERHVPSVSAADSRDADVDDGYTPEKELQLTRVAPRMETSSTSPVLFSSSDTRDPDIAAVERVTARMWHDSDYYGRDDYVTTDVKSDSKVNSGQDISPKSRFFPFEREYDQRSLDDEPFLSMEEYDGEREIFALKIWIDRKAW